MGKYFLCITFFMVSIASYSQVLTELPYGIIIGKTKNEELEKRGICNRKKEESENYFRCVEYLMAGGKFKVFSSENEIVSGVEFRYTYGPLPRKWRELGLEFKSTLIPQFKEIIKAQGASYIRVGKSRGYMMVNFEIGQYYYEARFFDLCEKMKMCLIELNITEAY